MVIPYPERVRADLEMVVISMEWLYAKGIPIEAQYLYRKASEMADRGMDRAAMNYYQQALIIAPAYTKALFEMGNCYAHIGKYREARVLYERAIRLNPEDPELQKRRDAISSGMKRA